MFKVEPCVLKNVCDNVDVRESGIKNQNFRGFTLVEVIVALAIVLVLSTMGITALVSRSAGVQLEETANSMVSDVMYARTAAALKGCPLRFVFCDDHNCSSLSGVASGGLIGSSGAPARGYSIMRQTAPCTGTAENALYGNDGMANWSHDVHPREVPRGIVFTAIYNKSGGALESADWSTTTANPSESSNSLYFSTTGSVAAANFPVMNSAQAANPGGAPANYILFQLESSGCDPATNEDCAGYFVTMNENGNAYVRRCLPAARSGSTPSDGCF